MFMRGSNRSQHFSPSGNDNLLNGLEAVKSDTFDARSGAPTLDNLPVEYVCIASNSQISFLQKLVVVDCPHTVLPRSNRGTEACC